MSFNNTTLANASVLEMSWQGKGANTGFLTSLIILTVIFVTGLIGNALVIAVVCWIPFMKTTTNYLLVNVAAADIITLLLTALHVLLSTLAMKEQRIRENTFFCKFIRGNTLGNVAMLATCLTLTVLSVERYNALLQPMKISRRLTKRSVTYVIVGIWLVSMVMSLPMFVYLDVDSGICSPGRNAYDMQISLTIILIFMTIVPSFVIMYCYCYIISGLYFTRTICNANSSGHHREELTAKRKLVKLLLMITSLFFLAYVPYGVTMILRLNLDVTRDRRYLKHIREVTRVMSYFIPFHSALNPLLYAFQSQNYREGFWMIAQKLFCKKEAEIQSNNVLTGQVVGTMV